MNNKGFSILEVILAAAIFMFFATGAVGTIIQGFGINRRGSEETIANQYASEGLEAVRSIKNQDFANLVNTSGTGVVGNATTGVWEFSGTENVLNTEKPYTRTLKIEDVERDAPPPCGNIVESAGTLDPDTKKITSTVSWNFTSSKPQTLSLTSYLSDWKKPLPGSGPIIMAYSKSTNIPYYRIWDGSAWGEEKSGQVVGGNITYVVVKSSRTRNEAVLGTLDSNGNIYAHIWNECGFGTPTLMGSLSSSFAAYRSFDIAYEKSNDRAMFIYQPNTSSSNPAYRIWDGTQWSNEATVTTPQRNEVRWIEITQNPLSASNEIATIMMDEKRDVYGMIWDGSSWNNMGDTSIWDTSASISNKKNIDVAYEQLSGRAMFIWADRTATYQYYRIWDGSTLSSETPLQIDNTQGGITHWSELVSRPNSNELMYGTINGGDDLNTRKWSGSAWDTDASHPEHDGGVEKYGSQTDLAFDLVWESHSDNSGKAWLVWGDGSTVSKKQWSGTAWSSASTFSGSDDTYFVKLKADPVSGAVLAALYESPDSANDDIWESHLLDGSSTWNAKNIIWGGPVVSEPAYFKVDIAIP